MSPAPRPGPVILAAIFTDILVAIATAMPRFRVSPLHVQAAWWAYRITRRINELLRRFAAGTLAPPRGGGRTRPGSAPAKPRERLDLPSFPNWLCPLVPGVSCYGTQIAHLFETNAEMIALAAAAPQLGRALRPLLRALGAQIPPVLRAPPCPPRPPHPAGEADVGEVGAATALGDRGEGEMAGRAGWVRERWVAAPPEAARPPPGSAPRDAARGGGA